MTKSYSGLERDNSKPRRGSFLNYFWTSSIHAVCFCNCYFNFNLRNPRKASQEEKQLKNLTKCGKHGKVIQRRAGVKNKLLEKGMKIKHHHWSNDKHKQLLLLQGNTQRRLSVKSLTTEIISSFPRTSQPRSLHLVHLHKPELFFSVFSGLLG